MNKKLTQAQRRVIAHMRDGNFILLSNEYARIVGPDMISFEFSIMVGYKTFTNILNAGYIETEDQPFGSEKLYDLTKLGRECEL